MEIEERTTSPVSIIVIGLTNSLMKTKEASTKKLNWKTRCRAIGHQNLQRCRLVVTNEV